MKLPSESTVKKKNEAPKLISNLFELEEGSGEREEKVSVEEEEKI